MSATGLPLQTQGLACFVKRLANYLLSEANDCSCCSWSWHYRPGCWCPLYLVTNQCSDRVHEEHIIWETTQWYAEGTRSSAPPGVRMEAPLLCFICSSWTFNSCRSRPPSKTNGFLDRYKLKATRITISSYPIPLRLQYLNTFFIFKPQTFFATRRT